jgi:hypothetical protein
MVDNEWHDRYLTMDLLVLCGVVFVVWSGLVDGQKPRLISGAFCQKATDATRLIVRAPGLGWTLLECHKCSLE